MDLLSSSDPLSDTEHLSWGMEKVQHVGAAARSNTTKEEEQEQEEEQVVPHDLENSSRL